MKRIYSRALSFLIALCLVISLAPVSVSAKDDSTVALDITVDYERAFALLDYINELRAQNRAPALVMTQGMLDAAVQRSAELMVKFSKSRPDGDICYNAYPNSGGFYFEEYLGPERSSDESWVSWNKNDQLLQSNFKSAGVSVFSHNNKTYILVAISGLSGTPAELPEITQTVLTKDVRLGSNTFDIYMQGEADMAAGNQQSLKVCQKNKDGRATYTTIWNNDSLTWTSSAPTVAAVHDGVVHALSAGTAEITVSAGASSASFTVTVTGEAAHTHTMAYREGKAPTYYEDGLRSYWYCTVCDRMYEEEAALNELTAADLILPMLICAEHPWNSGVITVASTSTKEGLMLYTCINCSAERTEAVPPNGKTPMHSGDLNKVKPTWQQLTDEINAVADASTRYVTGQEPSVTVPYETGKLTDEFLDSGLSYLNYIRYCAGLPAVTLSEAWNENAQYGAVVLAAINELTHYPRRPADMDKDFFDKGYEATTSSNISQRGGGTTNYNPLYSSVQGCMDDSTSRQNLSGVGHRRWLLSPTLTQVGFGYARSPQNYDYITTKVFDRHSTDYTGPEISYDFISWPASGNMTTNVFGHDVPWSIALNAEKYLAVNEDTLKITLTRVSDNTVWVFDKNTPGPDVKEKQYLSLTSASHGTGTCMIFSPGSEQISKYEGTYLVSVEGLAYADGSPASLYFEVDFRSIKRCKHTNTETLAATAPTCESDGLTEGSRCKDCGTVLVKQETIPAAGHADKDNNYTCDICGISVCIAHTEAPVKGYPATCTEDGLTDGSICANCGKVLIEQTVLPATGHTPKSRPSRDATCTESGIIGSQYCGICGAELVPEEVLPPLGHHFIDGVCVRCGKSEHPPIVNPFADVVETDFFYDPVLWAVEEKVTSGVSPTEFAPYNPCTRGQVVTFLWRAAGEPVPNGTNPFRDVEEGTYYYKAVLWAVEQGITAGVSPTEFAPDRDCTRGQIVTFLWRAAGKPQAEADNPFHDNIAAQFYYDAVLWAVEQGITKGVSDVRFGPDETCTRGQIVTFLYRYYNN